MNYLELNQIMSGIYKACMDIYRIVFKPQIIK